ncbi:MAG: trypsin-like peptidase domain-containing protein [Lachnospiraceae bacterium]|nr:trypsin-like peptidase domain-containing protein [Lachnospiraceae bacterium]
MNENNNSSYDSNMHSDFHNMSTSEYMNIIASNTINQNINCEDDSSGEYVTDQYTQELVSEDVKSKKKKGFCKFMKRFAVITASALLFGGVAAVMFNVVDSYIKERNGNGTELSTEEAAFDEDYVPGNDYATDTSLNDLDGDVIDTVVIPENDNKGNLDVSHIAEGVMPSIVAINVKAIEEYDYGMFGGTYEYESEGSGSGIIIGENDTELLIVTNNHVVSDAETVTVSFIDESVYEAKVKGTDSDNDLAIIVVSLDEISADTRSAIKVAKLGNSEELKVGEQVVAIGNALGYGQSVTTGIVSAVNRMNSTNATPLIQTDAAINPGNSGGALINMDGEVIGINSSKYMSTQVEGMGYAIPISEVESILDELMNRETREKVDEKKVGYLGVGCTTIDEQVSYLYGMPEGALVSEVMEDSPAERYGIKKNNIIVEFDGVNIKSAEQLVDLLEYYEVGEKVTVTVSYLDDDEYKEKDIEVVLGRRATSIPE